MKRLATLILAGFTIIACTEISFKEPQPAGIKPLSKVPSKIHGKYLIDNDTVVFFDKGIRGKENGKEIFMYLSDSIVLKQYKGTYFASHRDGNVWLVRILSIKKNGDLYLSAIQVPEDEKQKQEFMEKLSQELPIIESESHYIIEPSAKQLLRLSKKGFFKEDEKPWAKKIN